MGSNEGVTKQRLFAWLLAGAFALVGIAPAAVQAAAAPTEIVLPGARFEPLTDRARTIESAASQAAASDYYLLQFDGIVRDPWLDEVRSAGVEVLQYVPHQAFFVYGSADALSSAAAQPNVRWVGRYLPEDRLPSVLRAQLGHARWGAPLPTEITPLEVAPDGTSVFDVGVFARADLHAAVQRIEQRPGATVLRASALPANYFNTVRVRLPMVLVERITELPEVVAIDAYLRPQLEDERAAQIVSGNYSSTTVLNPPGYAPGTQFGVTGLNVTVALVDDGVSIPGNGGFYITAGNTVNGPLRGAPAGADSGHGHLNATVLAGTSPFGALDPTGYNYGLGVAPSSNIVNLPFLRAGYAGSDADVQNDAVGTVGPNGVRGSISNNSWGAGTNGNAYDSYAAQYDGYALDASAAASIDPLMLVFSAGNSGASGLTRPKVAKNIIATANSENIRTELSATANNLDDLATTSSRGPAADGRIKPEITAPGTAVAGGRAGDGTGVFGSIDANHAWSSGASHGAPQVAGAAALFTESWRSGHAGANPSPALIKAALLNGALEMSGANVAAPIPNDSEGWGRLYLKNVLNTGVPTRYFDQTTIFSGTGQNAAVNSAVADASKPVRVSLVWTDPPGAAGAVPALVNNLDLTVTVGANTYKGNVFSGGSSTTGGTADLLNNVENVFLPPGIAAGTSLSVTVAAAQIVGNGVLGNPDATDQHYALVIYNAAVPTAVRVLGFRGVRTARGVWLRWRTASERGLAGFDVYRLAGGGPVRLNRSLIGARTAGGVRGAGYWFVDAVPRSGRRLTYRLRAVRLDGTRTWVATARV